MSESIHRITGKAFRQTPISSEGSMTCLHHLSDRRDVDQINVYYTIGFGYL